MMQWLLYRDQQIGSLLIFLYKAASKGIIPKEEINKNFCITYKL